MPKGAQGRELCLPLCSSAARPLLSPNLLPPVFGGGEYAGAVGDVGDVGAVGAVGVLLPVMV